MEKQTVILIKEKDTKNTVRYAADPLRGAAACRTIYVERWALGQPVPKRIRVTLDEENV